MAGRTTTRVIAERDHNTTALIGDHEGELGLDGSHW
jgi:hypothetical protein